MKTGIILPLFKGKGAKANNKDNYRGITVFPTLCKAYEMILLNMQIWKICEWKRLLFEITVQVLTGGRMCWSLLYYIINYKPYGWAG